MASFKALSCGALLAGAGIASASSTTRDAVEARDSIVACAMGQPSFNVAILVQCIEKDAGTQFRTKQLASDESSQALNELWKSNDDCQHVDERREACARGLLEGTCNFFTFGFAQGWCDGAEPIDQNIDSAFEEVGSAFNDMFNGAAEAVQDTWDTAMDAAGDYVDDAADAVQDTVNYAMDAAGDYAQTAQIPSSSYYESSSTQAGPVLSAVVAVFGAAVTMLLA